jgi:hypothetical protein
MSTAPFLNSTNPGTVSPASQGFPPPADVASCPSSAPLTCSTGEIQAPASRAATPSSPTGTGLPAEIRPDSTSHVRSSPPAVATTTSPATDVRADAGRPGGLPRNVYVR